MSSGNVTRDIEALRRTLKNIQRSDYLLSVMDGWDKQLRAMECKAQKMAAVHQLAEITGNLIVELKKMSPAQEKLVTAMMFRGWAIRDRVNGFVYPDEPYVQLDHFFKAEKLNVDEAILIHGDELARLVSEFFLGLNKLR